MAAQDDSAALLRAGLGVQRLGLLVAAVGVTLIVVRALWLPGIPRLAPIVAIVVALGLIGLGMVRRARYHWATIKERRR